MKRWIGMLAVLAMLFALTGCVGVEAPAWEEASSEAEAPEPELPAEPEPEPSVEPEQPQETIQEPETPGQTEQEPEAAPEQEPAPETEQNSKPLELSFTEYSDEAVAGDDPTVTVASSQYQVPVVSGENQAAVSAIQAELDDALEDWKESRDESFQEAGEWYEETRQEGNEFYPYEQNLTWEVYRNDGRVFSVALVSFAYYGGMHGMSATRCMNFDAATGREIELEDLGGAFYAAAYDGALAAADQRQAEDGDLYQDYAEYIGDLLEDDSFYFADDGVVFVADTYLIASYATGKVELSVNYDVLNPVLPEAYQG